MFSSGEINTGRFSWSSKLFDEMLMTGVVKLPESGYRSHTWGFALNNCFVYTKKSSQSAYPFYIYISPLSLVFF